MPFIERSFRDLFQLASIGIVLSAWTAIPAAAETCDPRVFDGTYQLRCNGRPTLTLRGEIAGPRGKKPGSQQLRLSCDRDNDREFQKGVDAFIAWIENACQEVSPTTDCQQAAADLKASLLAIHDGLIDSIPKRMKVAVGGRNLLGHEMRAIETAAAGNSRSVTYSIAACPPHQGQRGDFLALGLPIFQGDGGRRGGCLAALAAVSSGHIDGQSFAMEKNFAVDGSLTCRIGDGHSGLTLHLGAKFAGSSTGKRH